MRVLFLLTTIGCRVKAHHPTGFLSAVLKEAGHDTAYLELDQVHHTLIDQEIARFQPHIVAASTVMQQFDYVRRYLNYIKQKYPSIKTVLGGTHPILKPDCIKEVAGLDALCISDGEKPLLDYVNSIQEEKAAYDIPSMYFRVDQTIIKNPNTYAVSEADMAVFPLQDRMVFPRFRYHDPAIPITWHPRVLWGRGCPYACSYCSVPSIKKNFKEALKASQTKWVRYPPVEKALEEIETLRSRWNFNTYVIDDDVFTTRKDWVLEFANKYPSHLKDKVRYEANLRVESVDQEIMRALKDTGCGLLKFGLENGNYDIRRKILNRPITDEKIKQVFAWAHEVGIPAHTFNIIGVPGETRETVWQTIKLNRAIRPERVQVTIFYPYVGTPLGDETQTKGLVTQDTVSYFSGKAAVSIQDLAAKDVERYAKWFKFLVYYPYAPLLAWQQFKSNTIDPAQVLSRVKALGMRGITRKLIEKILHRQPAPVKKLPVETMGADGEQPYLSPGMQELEDQALALRPQYDIEAMDINQPHMDTAISSH